MRIRLAFGIWCPWLHLGCHSCVREQRHWTKWVQVHRIFKSRKVANANLSIHCLSSAQYSTREQFWWGRMLPGQKLIALLPLPLLLHVRLLRAPFIHYFTEIDLLSLESWRRTYTIDENGEDNKIVWSSPHIWQSFHSPPPYNPLSIGMRESSGGRDGIPFPWPKQTDDVKDSTSRYRSDGLSFKAMRSFEDLITHWVPVTDCTVHRAFRYE